MFKYNTHGTKVIILSKIYHNHHSYRILNQKILSRNISKDEYTNIKISLNKIKPQFKSKSEAINHVKVNSESSQPEITDKSLFYKDVEIF